MPATVHAQWDHHGSTACGVSYVGKPKVTGSAFEVTCRECLRRIERLGKPKGTKSGRNAPREG